MGHVKELTLPRLGETMDEGRVTLWVVQPGQSFRRGETLLEVETDKTVVEVPALESGTLVEQLAGVDETVAVDAPIARVEVEGAPPAETPTAPAADAGGSGAAEPAAEAAAPAAAPPGDPSSARRDGEGGRRFVTPVARRIARQNGLDLAGVEGTGRRGRVNRADVEAALGRTGTAVASGQPGVQDRELTVTGGTLRARIWTPTVRRAPATVLLLHGLFGDLDTWAATASALNRAGLRVAALDLPAHGGSRVDVDGLDGLVVAVAEAVTELADGPVALVGHSVGGAVAIRVARTPDLAIRSLTLFAPVGLGTEIEQSFLDGVMSAGTAPALGREMGKLTVDGLTPSADYLDTLRERVAANAGALGRLVRELAWNGVQQLDLRADLGALTVPVRIIHGRDDGIVPWHHALNAPPRVAVHPVPRVGHMPQWEAGALTAELLARDAGIEP